MSGSFGESAKAGERLQPSLRSIRRNKAALKKAVLGAQRIERYSAGGIYLGLGYAVPVTRGAQDRVLRRIVEVYIGITSAPVSPQIHISSWLLSTRPSRTGKGRCRFWENYSPSMF